MLFKPSPKRIAAAVALAMAAGMAGSSWAAGLGRLTVQSALGQPLKAEVEISALTPAEAATLRARLASADAFRQAGLQFNPALANLRFTIDRRSGGRSFVQITSTQPINEPFVDLLVELNWASGRFVREYTFLLDPPELRTASREVVEGGSVIRSELVAPAVAPAMPPAQPSAAPPAASATTATAAAPVAAPVASRQAPAANGGSVEVRGGDTLAAIASRFKPASVSLDQALIAIYQANPGAFFGGVNRLRAGSSLAIPDEQAMSAVDAADARAQIRAHTRDFNAYRARLADRARTLAAAPAGQSAQGRIGASVDERGSAEAAGDQLRLSRSTPGAESAGVGAAGTAASSAAEQGVARDAAVREAQSRVSDLEKNVADLQQLLELKNRQLAELQKQVELAGAASQGAAGAIAQQGAGDATVPTAAASIAASAGSSSASDSAQAAPAASAQESTSDAQATAPTATVAADTQQADATKDAAPVAAKPAAATPATETSLLDDLMSNPMMLPGLAAILALGAGYGWYSMRRRRKVEKFEDSLIAADGFATNSLFGSTGGQSVDTTTSSAFAASTRDSGVDVHATEVDPIAEAEVYIAYGREAQAEEILREALKKQPERQAIRAKLLEILAGRKDARGFSTLAAEMYEQTGGLNEEWPKVVTMGLALDPDNPLYTGQPVAASGAQRPAVVAPEAGSDHALSTPVADGTIAAAAAALGAAGAAGALGVSLDTDSSAEEQSESSAVESDLNAVDFSVLDEPPRNFVDTRPLAEDVPEASSESEVPALDFDLDLDTTIGKMAGSSPAAPGVEQVQPTTELEKAVGGRFELPSLDLDPPGRHRREEASAADEGQDAVLGLDDLDIDLPSLESLTRTASPRLAPSTDGAIPEIDLSAIGLDLEVAPQAGDEGGERWQEMATKLDLASAYEEIGDKEGARELLDEVVKGGDSGQQHKARSMLARIV